MTSPSNEERRVRLRLHYDGTDFYGWQVQPEVRTVQRELEAAVSRLTDRPTRVMAAGRTDRGVHAIGQVASAVVPRKWTAAALRKSLNAVLPRDIWVAEAVEAPMDFHARYDAIARRYVYRIGTVDDVRSPFRRRWCWPVPEPPDAELLRLAAEPLVGNHSFASFAKSGQPERGERCIVHGARWRAWGRRGLELEITANRFLHHMVRYLVGTMVDIGRGRRPLDEMEGLLAGRNGLVTSEPAPPEGLYLARVYYTADELERESATDEDLP